MGLSTSNSSSRRAWSTRSTTRSPSVPAAGWWCASANTPPALSARYGTNGTAMKRKRKARQSQQTLTPAQQAAAKTAADRFDEACIQAHLSTEPVDEQTAKAYLRQ